MLKMHYMHRRFFNLNNVLFCYCYFKRPFTRTKKFSWGISTHNTIHLKTLTRKTIYITFYTLALIPFPGRMWSSPKNSRQIFRGTVWIRENFFPWRHIHASRNFAQSWWILPLNILPNKHVCKWIGFHVNSHSNNKFFENIFRDISPYSWRNFQTCKGPLNFSLFDATVTWSSKGGQPFRFKASRIIDHFHLPENAVYQSPADAILNKKALNRSPPKSSIFSIYIKGDEC